MAVLGNCLRNRIRQSIKDLNSSVGRWYSRTCNRPFLSTRIYFTFSLLGATAVKQRHPKAKLGRSKNDESDSNDDKEIPFDWNEFFKLLKPDIWLLILAVASALVAAFVNIKIPIMIGDFVNAMAQMVSTDQQDSLRQSFQDLFKPATQLVLYYGGQAALTCTYITLLSTIGENIAARMRKKLFASLMKQDVAFFDKYKTGEIISRLTADIQDFKSAMKQCISQGVRSITQTVGCIVSLYLISPKLTTLLVVALPSLIAIGSFIGSLLRKMSRKVQEKIASATAIADEAVGNLRTVRAFAMEEKEKELYNIHINEACNLSKTLGFGIGLFQGLANLAINGVVLSVLYYGGYLMSIKDLTPGQLMSFLVASQTMQRSLAMVSILFGQVMKGLTAGARTFEYMQLQPHIAIDEGCIIANDKLSGEVEIDNITFVYPTRKEQAVFRDFNLKIPAGKIIALCGPSGSGKSTIAALIERFYDVQSGSIKLDGIDIKKINPSWLRGSVIGYIHQEPVLFATSVIENIRYGRPDATDEEVVHNAARMANAEEFILNFPKGYETMLGERGVTVSGGQRQRIAIARALLKDPKILILDEATSALDSESEKAVQGALDRLMKGNRTVIVIAHRLSTIRNADVIAVIMNGIIYEIGNHAELMKKKGKYADMVRLQNLQQS
ncbi:uncharacterized protein TRIADDRAFT_19732 [Trichoplax adhaerens]|uniref:Mitochondrial potassium channel ATP-binding subunit n=1 Tax=Trichoplax adhaerens TaxID=10228 RepID=B3RLD7_TRIAD|nr:hypothetical protein TRIADDRAFT_19732 [Trichoplax adhaerens]EDV28750.1 hypothetical protein TRIADDRAFT_19732 [Trichoplax adhaerens]|eukprot:XP_002107952.1 hypothetical protein TRIADDRAFT_19732 [Trichoplax adhaerens]